MTDRSRNKSVKQVSGTSYNADRLAVTDLMIHERKLSKTLVIDGPLTAYLASVKATLNEIECSIAIQNEGFENLVRGSQISIDEVIGNAPSNWYLEAQEARKLGLIEAVL